MKLPRVGKCSLAAALLAAVSPVLAAGAVDGPPPRPGAESYYREVLRCLDALERGLPAITESASEAARRYVADDSLGIGAGGNAAFVSEARYRSGGLIGMAAPAPEKGWKGVVLYCLREDRVEEDGERLAVLRAQGCPVVLFGSRALLDVAKKTPTVPDSEVVVPSAPENGLFRRGDQWVVPTYETAAMAALWAWTGEFVAACTRQGKMPPLHQSIRVPGGRERNAGLAKTRFQDSCPPPAGEGALATRWLEAARGRLASLRAGQSGNMRRIAEQAMRTRRGGRRAFVMTGGHGAALIVDVPHDAGLFDNIDLRRLAPPRPGQPAPEKPEFQAGDFLLISSYDHVFNDPPGFPLPDTFRAAGGKVAFCLATYRKDQIGQIRPDETLVDTQWELGDADVELPGYDVKILPTSGVVSAAAFFMINSEMLAIDGENPPAK